MRCQNLRQHLAGLGALVGLHIALQHPSIHIQLLGRSGRPANIDPVSTTLQANVDTHIIMSRCDVNLTEEAAYVEDATSTNVLTQVIHSGNFEQVGAMHFDDAWHY